LLKANAGVIKFYDISQWQEKPHFQTGGTRDKVIVENPEDGNLYYFKTSLKRANDEYKHEFWSEIIASDIGRELGFNTLHYDVVINKNKIGCLSKSMVDANRNKLSEIINYLRGYDSNYNPNDKSSYCKYTFRFIEQALRSYNMEGEMRHIVTTIIFDSLIGNGDRHQENWGFIIPNSHGGNGEEHTELVVNAVKCVFAPIYDSGSCLGRELLDEKIEKMLGDDQMLYAYINRDRCEIRWDSAKKISHFDLIEQIMEQPNYRQTVEDEIARIERVFNAEKIAKIINGIDQHLPENLTQYGLPGNRKQLIKKIVSLRFDKLTELKCKDCKTYT
jgi:hypothetical protein